MHLYERAADHRVSGRRGGLHGKLIWPCKRWRSRYARFRISTIFVHICTCLALVHRRTRVIYANVRRRASTKIYPSRQSILMYSWSMLHLIRSVYVTYRLLPACEEKKKLLERLRVYGKYTCIYSSFTVLNFKCEQADSIIIMCQLCNSNFKEEFYL